MNLKFIFTKLNKITGRQAALIITIIGCLVYCSGLRGQFQGDDFAQIVYNVPVHSITNIRLFFEGGTFYNGHGIAPLSGVYYRPLMTTFFSLIYTLFGPQPIYFHVLQLLICIGSTIILYLFFRYSFKPPLALVLSLIFLVHPIDSQVAFNIANLQDALYFFFGILALYILIRFRSIWSLLLATLCLFLSLLAKETGVLFIAMALAYLFWWDRRRLATFIGSIVLPVAVWLTLKIHAVGLDTPPNNAPIDRIHLADRLFTAPSIILFYMNKCVFPWRLSVSYYWTYQRFSINHFLIPLLIDIAVIGLIIYAARLIYRKSTKAMYYTYVFFSLWLLLGLLLILQIIPLDFTASEAWFYFPMAGLLGMIGVVITVFPLPLHRNWLFAIAVLLIGILGARTALRGLDYKNNVTLVNKITTGASASYTADNILANQYITDGKFNEAKTYALRSINLYPTYTNYASLGLALTGLGNYAAAVDAYNKGLKYGNYSIIYEDAALLTLVYGNPAGDQQFLVNALNQFPEDSKLWMYQALFYDLHGNNTAAKSAIVKAARYGQVPQFLYTNIINDQPMKITVGKSDLTVNIP